MSVRHGKNSTKATLENQIRELQEEVKQKDNVILEQLTNTQLALCEIFESVVNPVG